MIANEGVTWFKGWLPEEFRQNCMIPLGKYTVYGQTVSDVTMMDDEPCVAVKLHSVEDSGNMWADADWWPIRSVYYHAGDPLDVYGWPWTASDIEDLWGEM